MNDDYRYDECYLRPPGHQPQSAEGRGPGGAEEIQFRNLVSCGVPWIPGRTRSPFDLGA